MKRFTLDREAIFNNKRVALLDDIVPIHEHLDDIEKAINEVFIKTGNTVIQSGRVIGLRFTDKERLISAFKAAAYLGKYKDMDNVHRFLNKMVKAGHSYEPIRGETILFMYIGVGKPVYDHIITYSTGRYTRIAAGQRANLPWGYEVPAEAKNPQFFIDLNLPRIREVVETVKGSNPETEKEQIQAMRSSLPVGFIMPPFLFEFSEEALIKAIFTQRIFEPGAQGATVEVVKDMWNIVHKFDPEKWDMLYDYHGPHIDGWNRAMRIMRDGGLRLGELVEMAEKQGIIKLSEPEFNLNDINCYDLVYQTLGRPQRSMWDSK